MQEEAEGQPITQSSHTPTRQKRKKEKKKEKHSCTTPTTLALTAKSVTSQ